MADAVTLSRCTALLCLLGGEQLSAADPQPPEAPALVISGSRYRAPAFDLPFSVDRVDPVQRAQPGINLSEQLTGVPGLAIQNRQNYAQEPQLSSRGFGARSAFGVRGIKLLSDGIPATTPDGQGQASSFDLDVLDHIEVLRGPFATTYGSNSGGVVQLFSRDGEGPPRLSGGATLGSWATQRERLTLEGGDDRVGYLVNRSHFETDGYRDHSAALIDKAFAKLTLRPDADTRLALIYSDLDQNGTQDPQGLSWQAYRQDPRSVSANTLLFNTRKTVDQHQGGLNLERRFDDASWQTTLYSGTRRVIQFQSIPVAVQANPRHSGGVIDFDREYHGIGSRWIQPFDTDLGRFIATAGVDYDQSSDDRQGYENFIGDTLGVKGALRRDERDEVTSASPYVQLSWERGDLRVLAGLRHNEVAFEVDDHYLVNGDDSGHVTYRETTPSLGLTYALTPDLNLYASWARGFETPTLNELSYSGADGGFGFGLQPASSRQLEVGLKALLPRDGRLELALFEIRTEDELVVAASQGGRTRYQNAAETRRRGLELGLEQPLHQDWRLELAYTWLDARYTEPFSSAGQTIPSGKRMPGIAEHTLFATLAWSPRSGLDTGLEGQWRSSLEVEDSARSRAAPGFALANAYLRLVQRQRSWTFSQTLRLDNLFDRDYVGSVIIGEGNQRYYEAGAGRSWYAGLALEYAFD
ncbi:TonB-dependent receptor [Pseudomonas sp. BN415]|uniref:TonB-dependent receptor family protein n=1 Tax=Pseudomonas sp. BN415 TaxID=2567889 RepID=UPI002457FE9D|nr:TonB-dependent receptor [Pseudomonas sp. BN415]MDH4583196.1 TonB-dependent receptor [Pseudomonas sp. BN415]